MHARIISSTLCRDKSFRKMDEADWDLVHKVHMKGSFKVRTMYCIRTR